MLQQDSSQADTDIRIDGQLSALADRFAAARAALDRVVLGQSAVVENVLVTLIAGGHGLLVGVPGLAKTRLVTALGVVTALDTRRVQFTPDLMPADILGSEILETAQDGSRSFRFLKGPVFCQLVMADEINRASPRTQSALLEAMQERFVTIAGARHQLAAPFHVLATQNPLEQEGTYPLPEAQLDRFLFQINVDYPDLEAEREMLLLTTGAHDAAPEQVLEPGDLQAAQQLMRHFPVPSHLVDAVLRVVRAARPGPDQPHLDWGAGPRAGQALLAGARARAFLQGRTAPLLDDVDALLAPALRHRMAVSYRARAQGVDVDQVIDGLRPLLDS